MGKGWYTHGSSKVEDYFKFINERHNIYIRRFELKEPKPWTDDEILQQFKFTNVFRELDKGTLVLREHQKKYISETKNPDPGFIVFNIFWYRYFNHFENMDKFMTLDEVRFRINRRWNDGEKIFTSAHMTTGRPGEDKHDTYLECCEEIWERRVEIAEKLLNMTTLQEAFKYLLQFQMVGPFIAYELASDFRWTPILNDATDRLSWANIGPGCKRGLERLGLPTTVEALQRLYLEAQDALAPHVKKHYVGALYNTAKATWPPFELREIEHCLCEFDKYERVRTGVGRPREKFKGR